MRRELRINGLRGYHRGVNTRQKLFAHHYVANKFNATQAAISAGYSERTAYSQGQRLLKHVEVDAEIKAAIRSALSETDRMTYEWLVDVDRIQKADLRKVLTWDGSSIRLKSSEELDDDTAYAISEIKETVNEHGGTLTVKLESKTRALELKGKFLAILNDNPPEPQDNQEQLSRDERRERLAALLNKSRERNSDS